MLRSDFIKAPTLSGALFTGQALSAQEVSVPSAMIWTSYDLGVTGCVEAFAMADALTKQFGTTDHITPSDTGVGRLYAPVRRMCSKPIPKLVMEAGKTIGMLVGMLAGAAMVVCGLAITGVGNATLPRATARVNTGGSE